ncbi:energy transducer TonB [Croceibacterium mercuriale]|uniref:energy transducer TonB n=1 Tax=Croceibacterium mercuriale TaxID=1572751 RepID=UPI000690F508|nr:energy transducer TonB [Croceibacterium mercuriale]
MLMRRTDGLTHEADMELLPAPSRYGSNPRPRLAAIGITLGVHVVLALALLGLGVRASRQDSARIVAVNLTPGSETKQPQPEQAPQPSPMEPRQLETAIRAPDLPVPTVRPAIAFSPAMLQPAAVAPAVAAPAPPAAAEPVAAAPAPPAAAATVQSGDLGTRVLLAPPPRYPTQSRRRREQGTVELLLTLGTDGSVEAISVSRSSGFERLDDAALSAVRRWRWQPTVQAGAPVRVRGIVAIPFVLAERA